MRSLSSRYARAEVAIGLGNDSVTFVGYVPDLQASTNPQVVRASFDV